MKRRAVVWFALFAAALLVVASPASAATAAQHTTAAEFSAGTLSNVETVGSGDSADLVFAEPINEDFEDGDASEFSSYSSVEIQNNPARAVSGSYTALFKLGAPDYYIETDVPDETHSNVSVYFQTRSDGGQYEILKLMGPSDVEMVRIYAESDNIYVDEGGASGTEIADISKDVNYKIQLTDINYGTADFDIDVIRESDGAVLGSFDDVTFKGGDSSLDTVRLFGNDRHYVHYDDLKVGSQSSGSYTSTSLSVDGATEAEIDIGTLSDASAEVTLEGSSGSGWTDIATNTYTSSGTKTVALSGSYTDYRFSVDYTPTGALPTVRIARYGINFDARGSTLSGPDPGDGTETTSYSGNISVNVTDADFATAQGDTLNVSASNQNGPIGSTTVTSNGTATITYSPLAGANSITWTVEDEYGETDTLSTSFSTPAVLKLRTETNPSQPINESGTADVTFFSRTTVETRPITNGTANLTGLPADETFVAVVDMDGFYQRRILIKSLFEQQRVFLLNESETAVDVEFELDDSTGQFSSGDVELTVEKAIVINGSTEFRVVVGDRISASGGLPASLEEGARYRLTVSKDGNTRSLGSWTASSFGVVTLPIGRIELSGDVSDEGWLLEHSIDDPPDGSNADGLLRIKFVDKANRTDSIETQVVRLNDSGAVVETVLANASETDTQSAVRSAEVNNTSDTFELRYTLVRDGETISGREKLGELQGIALPVDAGWLNLISWVTVFAFGGLVVIKDGRAAALVMAGSASLFAMLGWLQAPTAVLALGAGGAVVYAVAGRGGGF